jgi:hypothetical protein
MCRPHKKHPDPERKTVPDEKNGFRDGSAGLEDRGQYLWGLVHPINGAMRVGDYWGALGPLGPSAPWSFSPWCQKMRR